MNKMLLVGADLDRTDTWIRYEKGLCKGCQAACCNLPVEARLGDLIRLGVADEFERGEPLKNIAKRLLKEGVVEHFQARTKLFTLARVSNGDCLYLDQKTRLCTVYDKRPETCRNHPQVGPRPGYCAFKPQPQLRVRRVD
ncbi:YkgJ family cysteine cluster protein [Atopomonas sediminilitoris]|uniref:YkgJ family cysteine cluster protein n=1 Tax=Atopomonas sediminilitoris TaxID=2919919 RepID=UPI001F4EF91E|nr:YkgJ family cysteine cluster protein [Atopomonas sediminilitoris]MCJ8170220.1 YkgJ family cysteine cluster protein [Atopomonas sediminilitoris]